MDTDESLSCDLSWMDECTMDSSLYDIDPDNLGFFADRLPTPNLPAQSVTSIETSSGLFSPELGSIKPLYTQSPSILRKQGLFSPRGMGTSPAGRRTPSREAMTMGSTAFSPTAFFRSPQAVQPCTSPRSATPRLPFGSPEGPSINEVIAMWSSPQSAIDSFLTSPVRSNSRSSPNHKRSLFKNVLSPRTGAKPSSPIQKRSPKPLREISVNCPSPKASPKKPDTPLRMRLEVGGTTSLQTQSLNMSDTYLLGRTFAAINQKFSPHSSRARKAASPRTPTDRSWSAIEQALNSPSAHKLTQQAKDFLAPL